MTESISTIILFSIKIMALVGLTLYLLFALIIVRQEHLMASVLEEKFEPVVRLMTIIHLGFASFVLVMAFFLLP